MFPLHEEFSVLVDGVERMILLEPMALLPGREVYFLRVDGRDCGRIETAELTVTQLEEAVQVKRMRAVA